MSCSCIEGNYNFSLDSLTNKALIYQDFSNWVVSDDHGIPDTYDVKVLTPLGEEFEIEVYTSQKTKITPSQLGMSEDSCLLDGIYCFTVEEDSAPGCGTEYKRSKAYTPNLECCLEDLISKARTDSDFEKAYQIDLYIKSVHINSEQNKPKKAQEFFDLAQKELQRLNCNCNPNL